MAARLAQRGVHGPPDVLFGQRGTYAAFGGVAAQRPRERGGSFAVSDCYLKPYPCCRHLHPGIDAALAIRERVNPDPHGIRRVTIETYAIAAEHANTRWPDPATARFSYPYVVAAALVHGAVDIRTFDRNLINDDLVGSVAARIDVFVDPELEASYPARRPARATLVNGTGTYTESVNDARGSPSAPLSDAEVSDKFLAATQPALGPRRAQDALDALWRVETCHEIAELAELLSP